MKVLAIGAHFDDIELGCGGTLLKHRQRGDEICLLTITKSGYKEISGRKRCSIDAKREAKKNSDILAADLITLNFETLTLRNDSDLVFAIQKIVENIKPDCIYTHFPFDQHTDHAAVGAATIIAGRRANKILFYLSNFNPTLQPFVKNYVVDISKYIDQKMKLISSYQSEYPKTERWKTMFHAQAQADGQAFGFNYAETFMQFYDKGF